MKVTDLKFIIAFGVLLLSWGVFHWDAILGMESIWRRSDTFAHGYFILPISIWLIWRNRKPLLTSEVSTSWLGLLVFIGASLLGLIAAIADVAVVGQLAAVVSLIALLWLIVGDRIAWHYKFPLAYLLFLVPMGENLIPWLQDVTAWFTVFFLQMTGIPVFRDGLYIQTPTGLFEVAVACSGIRYLIASFAVGSLFAYLSYNKLKKQIIFTIFALLLPILANGIRAYLIVIIAHYSDMKYATGADHLVYGWLFFGIVIMLMFWVGGKFSEEEVLGERLEVNPRSTFNWVTILGATTIAIASSFVLKNLFIEAVPEQPKVIIAGQNVNNSNWGINFNSPVAKSFVYENGSELFIAKYANRQDKGELISFDNKLHDPESWTIVESENLVHAGKELQYLLLRNIRGKERAYIYTYVVGEYSTGSGLKAKLYQVLNTLFSSSEYSYVFAMSSKVQINEVPDKAKMAESLNTQIVNLGRK